MRYYRCRCGRHTAFGSMGPAECDGCKVCNTTLEQAPEHHTKPKPHKYVTKYDVDTGKPYELCVYCVQKRADIEAREEREREIAKDLVE